jgi:hypothetical protein
MEFWRRTGNNAIKSYFQDAGPIRLNVVVGVVAGQSLSKSASDLNLKKHSIEPRPNWLVTQSSRDRGLRLGKNLDFK